MNWSRIVKRLAAKIRSNPLSQGELIHRFQQALPTPLQERCRCKPDGTLWTSLEDLIAFAALHEPYVLPGK